MDLLVALQEKREMETTDGSHTVFFKISGNVLFDSSIDSIYATKPIVEVLNSGTTGEKNQDRLVNLDESIMEEDYGSEDSDEVTDLRIFSIECEVYYPRKHSRHNKKSVPGLESKSQLSS